MGNVKNLPAWSTDIARVLSYLKTSGRIYSIKKGVYSATKDDAVAGFAYAPFYYGLLSALTMRGLWTQHSRPDVMTMKRVRSSRTTVFGDADDVIFLHHVPAKYFFGFGTVRYGKFSVPVSDPEKTLIDLFYYNVRLSVQSYSGILSAIDLRRLGGYLGRYDERTRVDVKGFVEKYKPMVHLKRLESPY